MRNSLQQHSPKEVVKQLQLRIKKSGLDTIKVSVTRGSGKHKIDFTGSTEQVKQAHQILATWA